MQEQKTEYRLAKGSIVSTVVLVVMCLGAAAGAVIQAGLFAKNSAVYAVLAAIVAVVGILRSTGLADVYGGRRTNLKTKRLDVEVETARATSLKTRIDLHNLQKAERHVKPRE
jgi:hypothetical protein